MMIPRAPNTLFLAFFFFALVRWSVAFHPLARDALQVRRMLGRFQSSVHSEHVNADGLKVGDRVKIVAEGVVMKHLPKYREGLCVTGLEGEIKQLFFTNKDGVEIAVNRPVVVAFTEPVFTGHFEFGELTQLN